MAAPVILWFRRDLRLTDNPALVAAVESERPVLPLYILDEETPGVRALGGASRWWLHHALTDFARHLEERGTRLILRRGPAADVIDSLLAESGARAVFWNRLYEPVAVARDRSIKAQLQQDGVEAQSFNASLLVEPWALANKSGKPYGVFTPFWKALLAKGPPPRPLPAPDRIAGGSDAIASDSLADWALLPTAPDWAAGWRSHWAPGETGAQRRFEAFRETDIPDYPTLRDIPGQPGTSRLSPHLHFGEIGPRSLWHGSTLWAEAQQDAETEHGARAFLREIGWREFNHHLLFHQPALPQANFNRRFDAFPWRDDAAGLRAWQKGQTGYPIVDAGMRELWRTGWMHNRVRMIVASFLVKHLLVDWRAGEAWFWDTLVDADLANNVANWQWVAGCGADAAPYFRIFNPTLQGEKFDPDGVYVRRWVPEIAALPNRFLHKPWAAPADARKAAGLHADGTYPDPLVDHKLARERALTAYARIKKG